MIRPLLNHLSKMFYGKVFVLKSINFSALEFHNTQLSGYFVGYYWALCTSLNFNKN